MSDVITTITAWVWSPALVYLCLGTGLYFTIRTRLVQVRAIPEMLRLVRSRQSSASGVATAIAFGGPGAVFWMWVSAFLGASTAFVESTLSQLYKEIDDDGRYRGGPAYYIEKCLKQRWYALVFAAVTVVATGLLMPGIQANSIAVAMDTAWASPPGRWPSAWSSRCRSSSSVA